MPKTEEELEVLKFKYNSLWQNIDREDNLINHRIQWAIILSGGIFAASGTLAVVLVNLKFSGIEYLFWSSFVFLLLSLLSAIGVFYSRSTSTGVLAALGQIRYLKDQYQKSQKVFEEELGLPRPFGDSRNFFEGAKSARVFPQIMFWLWLVAAIIQAGAAVWGLGQAYALSQQPISQNAASLGSAPGVVSAPSVDGAAQQSPSRAGRTTNK